MLGVIFYLTSILAINVFTLFFMLLSKWWKDFMSLSLAGFFVVISITLDLSAAARFFPGTVKYITLISTPVLGVLAFISVALVVSFFFVQLARPKKKTGKAKKIDVKIPEL